MGSLGVRKSQFLSFLIDFDFLIFLVFWVVGKFWREATALCLWVSVGCKDSSGLVGFDYDGLHFSPPLAPPRNVIVHCAKLRRLRKVHVLSPGMVAY